VDTEPPIREQPQLLFGTRFLSTGMFSIGRRVQDAKTAAAAAGSVMATAWAFGGTGFGCLAVHFMFLDLQEGGIHPRGNRKSAEAFESKGVAVRPSRKRVRKKQKRKRVDVEDQNSGGKGRLA
jgi:hypothetical protein